MTQLRFGERLHGREMELDRLHLAFVEMSNSQRCRLVLVSGPAGIGKSALVREFQRTRLAPQALFASGKHDAYQRDIPHATLVQALRMLVREQLALPDDPLARRREAISLALGAHSQMLVQLIPELGLLLGPQAPLPELTGAEARRRLRQALCSFIEVFARVDHPLVLFLDDLQWVDAESLELIDELLIRSEPRHLMLIGAYRDDERQTEHAFRKYADRLAANGSHPLELRLVGLPEKELCHLLAHALRSTPEQVAALAHRVAIKAGGSPFFIEQFLGDLVEAGLLHFDTYTSSWRWDLQRIDQRQVTDNLVDLLVERLSRLTPDALTALQVLACMGNRIERARLVPVLAHGEQDLQVPLQEALRAGLLIELDDGYGFAHDRVHEAIYDTLSPVERVRLHLQIGRALLAAADELTLEDQVFEIASHLNQGAAIACGDGQRTTNALLNLRAGRKARASGAYAAACGHLAFGRAQLGNRGWRNEPELAFALALEHAECSFLAGDRARTRELVDRLLRRVHDPQDMAAVHRLKIELLVISDEYEEAVRCGLAGLSHLGIDLSEQPTPLAVQEAYAEVWFHLGGRPIEAIAELPRMNDARALAATRLLAELWPPTYRTAFNLNVIIICKIVSLSLIHGLAPASDHGFALLGWLMGPVFDRFRDGFKLNRLACELAQRSDAPLNQGRTFLAMGLTASWNSTPATAIEWLDRARTASLRAGDHYYACYCSNMSAALLLLRGQSLADDLPRVREHLSFATEVGFSEVSQLIRCTERPMACLLGKTRGLADYSDAEFDGAGFERELNASSATTLIQWYWTRKIMLHMLDGDPDAALAASERVPCGPHNPYVLIEQLEYRFFTGLALCARLRNVTTRDTHGLRARLDQHADAIRRWAEGSQTPTFVCRHQLLCAEIAYLDSRLLEAERLYDQAARTAHQSGFFQIEAMAHELASRFWGTRGFERIEQALLGDAIDCYHRWGANAKVRQLSRAYPGLRGTLQGVAGLSPASAGEVAEFATPSRAPWVASSDLITEHLISTLMRTVVEHAGAERAVLMLAREQGLDIAAEAKTEGDSTVVKLDRERDSLLGIPDSVIRFVKRTGESVVVDDARSDGRFSRDPQVTQRQVRSLLCLPIANKTRLQALLYLENNLAERVFTQAHLEVLQLLAAQATISLENARLYADLEARDYKIRRIFDVDVIGIVFWDLDGQLLDANDAFLRMLGYSREDLDGGSLRWYEMSPPEWHDQVLREVQELNQTGALRPVEKEYFRKDGTRVPVLIGAATFEGTRLQGVAFIIDLSQQKEAEARALSIERSNRELHAELSHTHRLVTLGHLSAWIAHDVKQPLAGLVASGNAGLRWLASETPNLPAAERALQRVVRDGMRAADILTRTRSLVMKSAPQAEPVDVNAVIAETLALIAPEADRKGILLHAQLDARLLFAAADRTQVQQVILNLLVNAMDAMAAEGSHHRHELRVLSTAGPVHSVRVDIRDTGPGLPTPRTDDCFEAFYSTKPDGLGMGLAICRSIVESFGGTIVASHNAPRGAVFRFELPMATTIPLSARS